MDEFTRPRNSKTNVDDVLSEERAIISDDDEEEDFDIEADEGLNSSYNENDEEESLIEIEGTQI